jgi:hypothetical protein
MVLGYTDTDEETMAEARIPFAAWVKVIDMPPDMLTLVEHSMERVQKSKSFFEKAKIMRVFSNVFSDYLTTSNFVNAKISNMIGTRCTGRVVAVTDSGYMALVPKGTKSNDKIYLMTGAHTPHVIRDDTFLPSSPILSSRRCSPRFRLVGEAYVHGLAADDAQIAGGTLQKIELY